MGPENKVIFKEKLEKRDEFGKEFIVLQIELKKREKLCRLLKPRKRVSTTIFFFQLFIVYTFHYMTNFDYIVGD